MNDKNEKYAELNKALAAHAFATQRPFIPNGFAPMFPVGTTCTCKTGGHSDQKLPPPKNQSLPQKDPPKSEWSKAVDSVENQRGHQKPVGYLKPKN
jgi:hypothetical protein